jgi:hypothetical protein
VISGRGAVHLVKQHVTENQARTRLLERDTAGEMNATEVHIVNPECAGLILEVCGPVTARLVMFSSQSWRTTLWPPHTAILPLRFTTPAGHWMM